MLPSPMNRTHRPRPFFLAAKAAPSKLPVSSPLKCREEKEKKEIYTPTDHPMLPHRSWLTRIDPSGNATSGIAKLGEPNHANKPYRHQ